MTSTYPSTIPHSPLDEYLAEAEHSFSSLGSPLSTELDAPKSMLSNSPPGADHIATGSRRAGTLLAASDDLRDEEAPVAGPSRLGLAPPALPRTPSRTPPRISRTRSASPSPSRSPSPQRHPNDAFAERFKFLVATSGLLEKTHLGSLNPLPPPTCDLDDAPPSLAALAPHRLEMPGALRYLQTDDGVTRWDVVTAIAVLILALAFVLGPTAVLVPSAALAAGATFLSSPTPSSVLPLPEQEAETPVETANDDEESGNARIISALEALLGESKSLDESIASALQLLTSRPDDTSQAHQLRIALNRLFDGMTDSLASTTSALIPMTDKAELAVLSDMYDIGPLGSRGARAATRRQSSSDEEPRNSYGRPRAQSSTAVTPSPDFLRTALLSPRERAHAMAPISALAASPFDPNDKFTKLPERAASRHKRSSWSTDYGSPSPLVRSGQEQRVLESEDDSMMSVSSTDSSVPASIPEGAVADATFSPPRITRAKVQPFTPKRGSPLTQALERLESQPPFPVLTTRLSPPSSQKPSRSPYRRSLQDIPYISSPSSVDTAAGLAVARVSASMSASKRRSLQTPLAQLPLEAAREEAITAGANLQRARSLPHGERASVPRTAPSSKRSSLIYDRKRQSLRPTQTTPSSKRTSLLFQDALARPLSLGLGPPPPELLHPGPRAPVRVASISPLTLAGLKAAFLGVHLKRRRVAGCLLGLRFKTPQSSGYWDEVVASIRALADAMHEGVARLETLKADAERDVAAAAEIARVLAGTPSTPPRSLGSPTKFGELSDYAPRDSTEASLLASVDELQRLLAHVWSRADSVRTEIASAEHTTATWSEMRSDVGGMLRAIERGREAVRAAERADLSVTASEPSEPADLPRDPVGAKRSHPDDLPAFLRAWAEEHEHELGSELGGTVESLVDEDEIDGGEDTPLPPPGVDEVFEATIAPAPPRAKSTLSREERIALAKEARARGITLAQLTAGGPPVMQPAREEAGRGEMVAELEGMFGAIRKRKGMEV